MYNLHNVLSDLKESANDLYKFHSGQRVFDDKSDKSSSSPDRVSPVCSGDFDDTLSRPPPYSYNKLVANLATGPKEHLSEHPATCESSFKSSARLDDTPKMIAKKLSHLITTDFCFICQMDSVRGKHYRKTIHFTTVRKWIETSLANIKQTLDWELFFCSACNQPLSGNKNARSHYLEQSHFKNASCFCSICLRIMNACDMKKHLKSLKHLNNKKSKKVACANPPPANKEENKGHSTTVNGNTSNKVSLVETDGKKDVFNIRNMAIPVSNYSQDRQDELKRLISDDNNFLFLDKKKRILPETAASNSSSLSTGKPESSSSSRDLDENVVTANLEAESQLNYELLNDSLSKFKEDIKNFYQSPDNDEEIVQKSIHSGVEEEIVEEQSKDSEEIVEENIENFNRSEDNEKHVQKSSYSNVNEEIADQLVEYPNQSTVSEEIADENVENSSQSKVDEEIVDQLVEYPNQSTVSEEIADENVENSSQSRVSEETIENSTQLINEAMWMPGELTAFQQNVLRCLSSPLTDFSATQFNCLTMYIKNFQQALELHLEGKVVLDLNTVFRWSQANYPCRTASRFSLAVDECHISYQILFYESEVLLNFAMAKAQPNGAVVEQCFERFNRMLLNVIDECDLINEVLALIDKNEPVECSGICIAKNLGLDTVKMFEVHCVTFEFIKTLKRIVNKFIGQPFEEELNELHLGLLLMYVRNFKEIVQATLRKERVFDIQDIYVLNKAHYSYNVQQFRRSVYQEIDDLWPIAMKELTASSEDIFSYFSQFIWRLLVFLKGYMVFGITEDEAQSVATASGKEFEFMEQTSLFRMLVSKYLKISPPDECALVTMYSLIMVIRNFKLVLLNHFDQQEISKIRDSFYPHKPLIVTTIKLVEEWDMYKLMIFRELDQINKFVNDERESGRCDVLLGYFQTFNTNLKPNLEASARYLNQKHNTDCAADADDDDDDGDDTSSFHSACECSCPKFCTED